MFVMGYAPAGTFVAVMTSVMVADPPGGIVTAAGTGVAVNPGTGGSLIDNVTVPEKLQRLVMVLTTLADAVTPPVSFSVMTVGEAVMLKSAWHPETGLGVPVTMKLRS